MDKFVISLGGSVAFDNGPNIQFLKNFCLVIKEEIEKGNKFVIIVGGGSVCREYQDSSEKIAQVSNEGKDWIGIYSTRLNARLLSACLEAIGAKAKFNEKQGSNDFECYYVLVGGGGVPGHSSDFTTVEMAINFGIKKVINLGKPDYVYTKDPAKFSNAKKIEKATWDEYLSIIPEEWVPGMNVPFDVMASKLAKENNIEVIVAEGKNLENFKDILLGKEYKGTTLKN